MGNKSLKSIIMKYRVQIIALLSIFNIGLVSGQSSLANPESIVPYNGNYLVSNIGQKLDAELGGHLYVILKESDCGIIEESHYSYNTTNLFHYGFIDSFLGGMYDGGYTYENLLNQGSFGLGAPDKLDGEVTILDGIAYQTRVSGNTSIPENSEKTPYAFVTNFSKDSEFILEEVNSKELLEKKLDERLLNINGMYAIKIEGVFKKMKTRAFPPVMTKPYPELGSMFDKQVFFNYRNIEGTLVGFRLPQFIKGVNIPGYHFHFISKDKSKGGHLIEVEIGDVKIEIDMIDSYSVKVPDQDEFKKFDFNKDRSPDVRKAESGKNK